MTTPKKTSGKTKPRIIEAEEWIGQEVQSKITGCYIKITSVTATQAVGINGTGKPRSLTYSEIPPAMRQTMSMLARRAKTEAVTA